MHFDSHAHLHPGTESLQRLLDSMESLNISRTIVVGGGLVPPGHLKDGTPEEKARAIRFDHRGMLAQCAQTEGRLLPFYFANPWIVPLEYLAMGASFYGLKLGPAVHGVPLNSASTRSYIEIAKTFGHIVYLHCLDRDGFRISDLVQLARDFSNTTFILGHGGIGHLDFQGIDDIAPFKNIYYETSGTFKATVRQACKVLGSDRVLFGSEFPLQSARAEMVKIEDLALSKEEHGAVMGGNISRLLEGSLR